MSLRRWWIKGLIQNVLCRVPGGKSVNDRLQTSVGGLRDFEGNIQRKVGDWLGIVRCMEAAGRPDIKGLSVLEVGTGWYSCLPFCFALAGASRVITVDLLSHLNPRLTFAMLAALEAHVDAIAAATHQPVEQVRERLRVFRAASDLDSLLTVAGVTYKAPQFAQDLHWIPDSDLDIVYSNSVLEHIPPDVLPEIMKESHRLLRPGGLMVQAVACHDHYAHFDKRISYVNYLQYSDRQWRWWNNPFHYQNRLRAKEFLSLAGAAGFDILYQEQVVRPGTREALERMQIAQEFRHFSPEELAATTVNFVATRS